MLHLVVSSVSNATLHHQKMLFDLVEHYAFAKYRIKYDSFLDNKYGECAETNGVQYDY